MIKTRPAVESDVDQIREIFYLTYAQDYPFTQYYDSQLLKKLVFADDTILMVAEDTETGTILGTGSVVLEVEAYADLVGEFGRLAVRPEARGKGVGKKLLEARLGAVQDQLHVGIADNRVAHPFSQRISAAYDFASVGLLPMKLRLSERESIALYARFFGEALSLRRNNPRVIPEVSTLAELCLENCKIDRDVIVDGDSSSYPHNSEFKLDELSTSGYSTLLRFERGRVRRREVFGPMRLHYGLFKLRSNECMYLLALDGEQIAGAIGFSLDQTERTARIFELISSTDQPIHFLLQQALKKCLNELDIEYLEVDVNAHAPRMQRTLLELGFLPAAYVPALVFHNVERLDIVKMVRVAAPLDLERMQLSEVTKPVAQLVLRNFRTQDILPRVAEAVPNIRLFSGLNAEQVSHLAAACSSSTFEPRETIFSENERAGKTYLILSGEIDISLESSSQPIASVTAGESLGEISLLSSMSHSATATARTEVEAAVLDHAALTRLVRMRPDIGLIIYRNLAAGLGEKLQRSDLRLLRKD